MNHGFQSTGIAGRTAKGMRGVGAGRGEKGEIKILD